MAPSQLPAYREQMERVGPIDPNKEEPVYNSEGHIVGKKLRPGLQEERNREPDWGHGTNRAPSTSCQDTERMRELKQQSNEAERRYFGARSPEEREQAFRKIQELQREYEEEIEAPF